MTTPFAVVTTTDNSTSPTVQAQYDVSVGNTDRPDIPHPSYHRMAVRWAKCRALMLGTQAIRDGGDQYLARFDEETDDSYTMRVNLAALMNGFERVVTASVGMLMQQEPELGEDMPSQLVDLWENINASGMHGAVFTRLLALDAITDGHAGILVDYPRVANPATTSLAEEQQLGLRPYWVLIRAEDIFLQHYEAINGVRTLTLLVLREITEERVGKYGIAAVTRYRVYTREGGAIYCEVFKTPALSPNAVPTVDVPKTAMTNVGKIPFAPFLAGTRIGPNETKPPLLSLADLCIEHHQIKTGILHLEQLAFVPTVVRTGHPGESDPDGGADRVFPPVVLGPRSVIDVPVNGKVEWLTPKVDVLAPAEVTLQKNESAQGAAGLAFLAPEQRHAETAQAKRIDAAAQNATLATVGRNLGDTLEEAFGFTGDFLRVKAGSVTVNTDFENTVMDAQMILALNTLAASGNLDIETLLDLLVKGKVIPGGIDPTEIIARILKQNAAAQPDPATLPDNQPPGGKRPTKATVTDTATGKTHTIVTE